MMVINEAVIAVIDAIWIGFSYLVFIFFSWRIWIKIRSKKYDEALPVMVGVCLVAISNSTDQLYWMFWRVARAQGAPIETIHWYLENNKYLIFLSLLTIVGYTLHLHTSLVSLWGRRWWVLPIIAAAVFGGSTVVALN